MPKIFGTPIWVIILAGLAFWMVGFVFYGVVFAEKWMALSGLSEADFEGQSMAPSMIGGIIISIMQAAGLAGIMKAVTGYSVGKGVKVGFLAWLLFALPVLAYDWNYANEPTELLMIDGAHLLVGYLVMGVVLGLLRKPETIG